MSREKRDQGILLRRSGEFREADSPRKHWNWVFRHRKEGRPSFPSENRWTSKKQTSSDGVIGWKSALLSYSSRSFRAFDKYSSFGYVIIRSTLSLNRTFCLPIMKSWPIVKNSIRKVEFLRITLFQDSCTIWEYARWTLNDYTLNMGMKCKYDYAYKWEYNCEYGRSFWIEWMHLCL